MISPDSVRINNLVEYKDCDGVWHIAPIKHISEGAIFCYIDQKDVRGIEIKNHISKIDFNELAPFIFTENPLMINIGLRKVYIRYVHHLQQIYFDIFGEELEINL